MINRLLDSLEYFLESYIDEPGEYDISDFSYYLEQVRQLRNRSEPLEKVKIFKFLNETAEQMEKVVNTHFEDKWNVEIKYVLQSSTGRYTIISVWYIETEPLSNSKVNSLTN